MENSVDREMQAYHELQAYTLQLGDEAFIHQHVVDAWTLQHADERTKPIAVTFALVGLYLYVERGFSGRQVQRVHMLMGRRKRAWPKFVVPARRPSILVSEIVATPPGFQRARAIASWCRAVWEAWRMNRATIIALLQEYEIA
jgi:hypothetical protein